MEGRFLLDFVVSETHGILELLTGKDEASILWRDAGLVMDAACNNCDGVGGLHVQCDGLASEGLDKDLNRLFKVVWHNFVTVSTTAMKRTYRMRGQPNCRSGESEWTNRRTPAQCGAAVRAPLQEE